MSKKDEEGGAVALADRAVANDDATVGGFVEKSAGSTVQAKRPAHGDGAAASTEPADASAQTSHDGAGCCGGADADGAQAAPRYKAQPRSDELQRDIERRLNRVIGQLNGVKSMIDQNRYCGDVLTQLAAAQSALKSVSSIVLNNHMKTCVVQKVQQGDLEVIDELSSLIKKFSK